jgi:hypothetical protein
MLKTDDQDEVPPQVDEDGNQIVDVEGSKSGPSKPTTLKDLMKKLKKLSAKNEKLKAKDKKGKTYSSSSEDGNSSFEEEVSNKRRKGKKKHDKTSYNSMSLNYNNMPSSTAYTSTPVGKVPCFDGTNYNQWKHCMKIYLYSISPEVWQVVCDDVDFPNKDE